MHEIRENFSAGLKAILKEKKIHQKNFAKQCGMSESSLSDYKLGRRSREDVKLRISSELGWSYQNIIKLGDLILGGTEQRDAVEWIEKNLPIDNPSDWSEEEDPIPGAKPIARRLPVISFVQAGNWHEAIDNFQPGDADEWVTTTSNLSEQAFSLRVVGKSMEPEFWEGEFINVDPNAEVNSGDYIIAKNGNEEATFKKYYKDGDRHFLVPLNEDWGKPRDMTGLDWRIVGRVMEKVKKY